MLRLALPVATVAAGSVLASKMVRIDTDRTYTHELVSTTPGVTGFLDTSSSDHVVSLTDNGVLVCRLNQEWTTLDTAEHPSSICISPDGETVAVGFPDEPERGPKERSGVVRLYRRRNDKFTEFDRLTGDAVDEEFGKHIQFASNGDLFVAGKRTFVAHRERSGRFYGMCKSTVDYPITGVLAEVNAVITENGLFTRKGRVESVGTPTAAVGGPFGTIFAYADESRVHFLVSNTSVTHSVKGLGRSMGASEKYLAVGAPDSDAVVVYDITGNPREAVTIRAPTTDSPWPQFGACVRTAGDSVFVAAPGVPAVYEYRIDRS